MPDLSSRALSNIIPNPTRDILGAAFSNPWSGENPKGVFPMGLAENQLMHPELMAYVQTHMPANLTSRMLTYNAGPSGSPALRSALASFINARFSPHSPISSSHVQILNGVASVIEALLFCICDPGEGILIARPLYAGFVSDFEDKAKTVMVPVSMGGDKVTSLQGVKCHEDALLEAREKGVKIKAMMLCNPHNPLGRCYPQEVIEWYLSFCEKYDIHFISDEVYAKSVFPSNEVPNPLPFTSVLSLDIKKFINPSLVHVLYGMSKDFSCNGLRIGALISPSNPALHSVLSTVSKFAWASSISDLAWTLILRDGHFLNFYFDKMTTRLTAAYEFCVCLLKEEGIGYTPSNCGPFVWIDLSSFMDEKTVEAERNLAWKMIECGVWLSTGESYCSEEPGRFRFTFATSEDSMRFGIARLRKALHNNV